MDANRAVEVLKEMIEFKLSWEPGLTDEECASLTFAIKAVEDLGTAKEVIKDKVEAECEDADTIAKLREELARAKVILKRIGYDEAEQAMAREKGLCSPWDYMESKAVKLKERVAELEARCGDVEGIRHIIEEKELTPTICNDSGIAEWCVGESRKLATHISKFLKEGI